ncbi:hypothetical protein AB1N83_010875 [Pleurotus pulmonarius]
MDQHPTSYPSVADVARARELLQTTFPRELVDHIFDLARYWPRVVSATKDNRTTDITAKSSVCAEAIVITADSAVSLPSSNWLNPPRVRMVKFVTHSHDQGWGGNHLVQGSYKECWSWFEVSILRLNKDTGAYSEISVNGKQRLFVQSNAHATSATAIHEVEWEEDSNEDDDNYGKKGTGRGGGRGFVKAMQPGDKISLVAIARFPGWANIVEFAQIEVYYSV